MRTSLISLLILTFLSTPLRAADEWPQFRGPGGQGHSDAVGLPLRWGDGENVTWTAPVAGRAWSSPVISGEQIWLTTAEATQATADETRRKLDTLPNPVPSPVVARRVTLKAVCAACATGRVVRSITLLEVDDPPPICSVNSFASPTPVVEAGRLYCDFGTMGTACVDTSNGRIVWARQLPIDHQVGPGSSPAVYGELLVLVRDGCDEQYLVALNKRTGATAWKTNRPPIDASYTPYRKAFSTPLVIDTRSGRQMVVPGAQWIAAYDPDSGKPIWRVDTGPSFSNSSRPVFGHAMVYVCTAFGGSQLLAIRVDGRGDVTDTHVAWKSQRQIPKRSSPLLVGDEVYILSDNGVLTCLDAHSGTTHWAERILGNCSASPLLADGRIYCFDERGQTAVVRPGRQFALLAKNELDGQFMASPAVAHGALFLRSDSHLWRIEKD